MQTGFRGVDRRVDEAAAATSSMPAIESDSSRWRRNYLFFLCAATIVALLPLALAHTAIPVPGDGWRFASLAGVVGLVALMTWLGSWALSGRLWPAFVALAVTPAWAMSELAGTPAKQIMHRPAFSIAAFGVAGIAFGWLVRAIRAPQVDSRWRPFGSIGTEAVCVAALFVAVGVTGRLLPAPVVIGVVLGVATVAAWWITAGMCLRWPDATRADRHMLGVSLLTFGLAAADRTAGRLDYAGRLGSWALVCGCAVALIGWLVLLGCGLHALVEARDFARWRQAALRGSRDEITRRWNEERRAVSESRHDLRSLTAGIHHATSMLLRYRDHLDTQDQQQLEFALASEIRRLAHALEADPENARRERFSLRSAIEPVIVAERARGTVVWADLVDVEVVGSADDTAAHVQNLLLNAYRHAQGAEVCVLATVDGLTAKVRVVDDGPGLPEAVRRRAAALFAGSVPIAERELVAALPRQRVGAGAGGWPVYRRSGLGLAICARLAREQGGRIRMLDVARGTAFELSLPLACPVDAGWLA